MKSGKLSFRHESLQDATEITEILTAISRGISRGKLSFNDTEDSIELTPEGLMNMKITASKEDSMNRVNIRIAWQSEGSARGKRKIKVKSK